MRLLLLTLFILLVVVLLIFINTNGFSFGEIIVDNTKKRTMVTTVIIMECLKNETQCVTKEVYTNRTDLGNVSKGHMRITNI